MSPRQSFYLTHLGLPLLLALVVFVAFDLTGLDRWFSQLFIDPASGQFTLLHDAWFEKVTHKWPRILPNWTGEAALIGALLSFVWPLFARHPQAAATRLLQRSRIAGVLRFTTRHRRDLLFVVVAFALCTAIIHYLKSHTGVYCPVETTFYGGAHPRLEWYQQFDLLHKAGDGRCWPGGHASSGFTLMALYFVARRWRWAHARKLLGFIVLLGMMYGTTRVMQGWHYMSHTFWAGIFVWLTCLPTALCFYGRTALQAPLKAPLELPATPRRANAMPASLRPE